VDNEKQCVAIAEDRKTLQLQAYGEYNCSLALILA